jgi:hypothetical protein
MATDSATAEKRQRRDLLTRWSQLRDRALAAQPESEARQWVEEWTREWRAAGCPMPPTGLKVLGERVELLEYLLDREGPGRNDDNEKGGA